MPFLIPFIAAALVEIGIGAITASIIASAIVAIGLSLVATLIQAALMPKPADGKVPKRQPIPPRIRAFGRCRLGGAYMLYEVAPQGRSFDVLALHDGLIDGYERYFLHDDEVTLDGSGFVGGLANGAYGGKKIRIVTRLGETPETAYTETEVFSMLSSAVWNTNCRGDGIASLMLICRSVSSADFQKIYPQGLPQPSVVARWRKCFDPRVSGQDANDPSTWAFSDNPVCALVTYLIDDMEQDYDTRILPEIASWIHAANVCDEDVTLNSSGSEKRYALGGFYQMDNEPSDVLATILSSFDGWLGETGSGGLKVYAGEFYSPTVTIEGKHIIAFRVQKFIEDENAVNEIIFSYVDPAQKYTEIEGDPVRDEADISARGKVRSQSVSLNWVQSQSRARRLATRELYRLNAEARGTIKTDLYGFLALGERYININIPELPSLCTFSAQISNAKIDLTDRSLTFDWIKVAADIDDWDPTTQEGTPPSSPPPADDETLPTPDHVSVTSDGSHLLVTFDTPERDDLDWAVRYRTAGTGSGTEGDWVNLQIQNVNGSGPPPTTTVQTGLILPNTAYEVQVAFVGPAGTYSDWSDTASTTTPASTSTVPLRIIGGTPGRAPLDGEEFFNALMAAGDEFLDGSGGSFARAFLECEVAPSDGNWVCTLKKNGTTVATGTITTGSTSGTWSGLAGPLTFTDADNLTLTGPLTSSGSSLDSTFSGLAFGFFGTRTV